MVPKYVNTTIQVKNFFENQQTVLFSVLLCNISYCSPLFCGYWEEWNSLPGGLLPCHGRGRNRPLSLNGQYSCIPHPALTPLYLIASCPINSFTCYPLTLPCLLPRLIFPCLYKNLIHFFRTRPPLGLSPIPFN